MNLIVRGLAPAWMIIIGGLMIIPGPGGPIVICPGCGAPIWTTVLGVITIALGALGLWSYLAAGQQR